MTVTLTIFVVLMTLYSFYLGGRLKQAEQHIEIIRVALDGHLTTGKDYRSAEFKAAIAETRKANRLEVVK